MLGFVVIVLAALGLLFSLPSVGGIGEIIVDLAKGITFVLVILLPVLAVLAPLWFITSRREYPVKANVIILGVFYGFVVLVAVWQFGLLDLAVDSIRSLTGSWLGGLTSALVSVLLVLEGLFLRILDIIFGGIVNLKSTLKSFFNRAKRLNETIWRKIKGRRRGS